MSINQKGFTPIALIVAILTIVIVLGIYKYVSAEKNTLVEQQPQPISNEANEPYPTNDPNPYVNTNQSEWKTYISEDKRYSFKYPPEVSVENGVEQKYVQFSKNGPTQKAFTEFYDGISITVYGLSAVDQADIEKYIKKEIENAKVNGSVLKDMKKTKIGEYDAWTYTVSGLGDLQYIFIKYPYYGNSFLKLTNSSADPGNHDYMEIAEQIINTVQFMIPDKKP